MPSRNQPTKIRYIYVTSITIININNNKELAPTRRRFFLLLALYKCRSQQDASNHERAVDDSLEVSR